ncbi:MAG: MFS transporter [Clostridia bacterium]|nr:MFS transporter [Clostridia bacterium]
MKGFKRVKLACYSANISMSIVGNLSPILFLTFRSLYGISYTLLGLLVLINFVTQLIIDLIFSFFSHKFNIQLAVKMTPVLTLSGLIIFALSPFLFPSNVYIGLVIGTVIFSASGGFAEVLISPVIAAIPSENPEREMSKLHSIYAWGVVGVIIIGTLFLLGLGGENWQYLAFLFAIVPFLSIILFAGAKLPELETPKKVSGALSMLKRRDLWICVLCIFLGGAAECTMAQWSSGYIEMALGIPKVWGDIFGVALFGLMLGLGRTLYSKYGKNIERVLFLGAIGATLCYLTASISGVAVLGLIACAFTGFCVSMMWPGSLIVAEKRFPSAGVFIFAMMAAGGDLGASVGPQLIGIVTDAISVSTAGIDIAARLSLSPEQVGMKAGMLIGMLFCLAAVFVYLYVMKKWKNSEKGN